MGEISALTKENLEVNRRILAALKQQNQVLTGHTEHTAREPQIEISASNPCVTTPVKIASQMQTPISGRFVRAIKFYCVNSLY